MFESFALSPRSLGVARVLVGIYLVLYRPAALRWINALPSSFFRPPPGPLRADRPGVAGRARGAAPRLLDVDRRAPEAGDRLARPVRPRRARPHRAPSFRVAGRRPPRHARTRLEEPVALEAVRLSDPAA